jgi:hypothetical protein
MVRAAAGGQTGTLVNRGSGTTAVGKPTGPTGTLGRRKAGAVSEAALCAHVGNHKIEGAWNGAAGTAPAPSPQAVTPRCGSNMTMH